MANDKRDETSGRFGRKYDDADFIDALENVGGDEREAGTKAVADVMDVDRDTARRRLHALADDGRITRREIAGSILWRLTSEPGDPRDTERVEGSGDPDLDPQRVVWAIRLTTPDSHTDAIAQALGEDRESVRTTLKDLADAGRVERRDVGDSGVWRVVD